MWCSERDCATDPSPWAWPFIRSFSFSVLPTRPVTPFVPIDHQGRIASSSATIANASRPLSVRSLCITLCTPSPCNAPGWFGWYECGKKGGQGRESCGQGQRRRCLGFCPLIDRQHSHPVPFLKHLLATVPRRRPPPLGNVLLLQGCLRFSFV